MIKDSTYDNKVQLYLIFNIILQIILCALLATGNLFWLRKHPMDKLVNPGDSSNPVVKWLINFMSWMLLMT